MKLGINGSGLVAKASIQAFRADVESAITDGFESYWIAEHPNGGLDALTVITALADTSAKIELGTAIIPTWPRHPMVLAAQALTTQSALNEYQDSAQTNSDTDKSANFTLGIGMSHATMMAELGITFEKPIRHLRDYLSILMPLLTQGQVNYQGETLSCEAKVFKPSAKPVPVVVAALGPQALKVAGTRTDGTTLAWVGPKTIANHIKPRLSEAAEQAGRPKPRIIATLPVCVTDTPEQHRELVSKNLAMYGKLPSYKAMFEREGVTAPGELAILGSKDLVLDKLQELADAGVTDFGVSIFGLNRDEHINTRETLKTFMATPL